MGYVNPQNSNSQCRCYKTNRRRIVITQNIIEEHYKKKRSMSPGQPGALAQKENSRIEELIHT